MSKPNTPSYKTLNWPEYNRALDLPPGNALTLM